ncbi:hypothetical protein [Aquisediminimonas profunda]|uniref:hypothetical protein n=1 Tax=Aquisediminimonas profunda TaxID=1550733 RepID=UPI001C62B5B5|nr:hypothetical protein [Aquisediminimonas profunda]
MTRHPRIDSASQAVEVMKAGMREIAVPGHVRMTDEDWPFWHSVVSEFARSQWTDHSLELAAMLARSMADLEREQHLVRLEGFIVKRRNGTKVENPRSRVVKRLTSEILSLRRSLALHARARGGDMRNIRRRSDIAKAIEASNPLNDRLLGP